MWLCCARLPVRATLAAGALVLSNKLFGGCVRVCVLESRAHEGATVWKIFICLFSFVVSKRWEAEKTSDCSH